MRLIRSVDDIVVGLEKREERFTFLGFTPSSGQSRQGRLQMQRRTIAQRLRAKLAAVKVARRRRLHLPVPVQGAWLRSVVLGHDQYYGVPLTQWECLTAMPEGGRTMVDRRLSRRSQKGYVIWERMNRSVDKWLPVARISHPYPDERFGVMTQGRSPVR